MKERMTVEALVELVGGDDELVSHLVEIGLLEAEALDYGPDEIELVLVCFTLVRDLEVNWPGVEVALRLRRQLLDTRRRLAELAGERRGPRDI